MKRSAMKLETKHVIPYLGHKLNILVDDVICEVEGIDLHQKDTVIAERVNYKLENVKLVLYPLDYYNVFEEILGETTAFEILTIEDNPDMIKRLSYEVIELMFKYHIDIFGLINHNLAINKSTL